jgi:hypothetical protein
VKDSIWEPSGQGWKVPAIYVARGGVITLFVELQCDGIAEPEHSGDPSPASTNTGSL